MKSINRFKDNTRKAFNNASNFASTVVHRRQGLSPKVLDILSKTGNERITGIRVGRTPVQGVITGIIKIVSSTPYDTLFHLFIIIDTERGPSRLILEKNAVINMDIKPNIANAEYMTVPNVPSITINQLVDTTAQKMGDRFIFYSAYGNNCQDFIYNVLTSNGMNDPSVLAFVKQDTNGIFNTHPNFRKFANVVTNLGGSADVLMQGGSLHRSNELNNKDISNLMRHFKIPYHGCYIKDELPRRLSNGFYIINLNGKSHWTALLKNGPEYYYFDSFGFPPPQEVERQINDCIWNTKDIQSMASSSCGYYVVAWCRFILHPKNKEEAFGTFLHLFSSKNLMENENILASLLQ